MEYRREIDGLRALAVLPVILFHAGFQTFSGGFVGVDVFFVISGYLITSIIISEKKNGTFSLLKFYERRARRILPPLFLVMFTCLPFAWLWLVPPDLETFSKSLLAVTGFVSNIQFWQSTGYFAPRADLQPLLHTWSLAVEEQYYLLFPVLFLLMLRLGTRWTISILAVAALTSLIVTEFESLRHPAANFFLLPTRAWELLIGVLVAVYLSKRTKPNVSDSVAHMASLFGLLLIMYAVLALNKQTPFPSLYTLIPTIGTGLIILFATPRTIVGRLLSARLFVGIGLISYSAYLWHQPLFAFAKHRTITEPSNIFLLMLAGFAFVLAYLSFKYVEKPFRHVQRFSRAEIFSYSALCSLFFISFGIITILNHGFPFRASDRVMASLRSANEINPKQAECMTTNRKHIEPSESCILGNSDNIVGALVGDSHSDALAYAFSNALTKENVGMKQLSFNGCPPVLDLYRVDDGTDCSAYNKSVYDYVKNHNEVQILVLVARWTLWLEGVGFDNGEGGVESNNKRVDLIKNGVRQTNNQERRKQLVKQMYVETIKKYLNMGKKVILIYPIPAVGWDVPAISAKREFLKDSSAGVDLTTSYTAFKKMNKETTDVLDSIGKHKNLMVIRPEKIFCESYIDDRCIAQLNGKSLYTDDNHLSITGAGLVIDEIMKRFDFKSQTVLADFYK